MRNSREALAARGLRLLGEATFVDFLRSIRDTDSTSIRIANEALDEGQSVRQMFFTGEELGFHLRAHRVAEKTFKVEFSCVAGPLAADGGTWEVAVDEAGAIVRASVEEIWLS